jgi:erythrin-vacuolar iron transport family protein
MTSLGGIGHTLPFLIPNFRVAFMIAFVVVLAELGVVTWVRHRYMETPTFTAAKGVASG